MDSYKLLVAVSYDCLGDTQEIIKTISERKMDIDEEHVESIYRYLDEHNITAFTMLDRNFPNYLKQVHMPPIVLFCKGNIDLLDPKYVKIGLASSWYCESLYHDFETVIPRYQENVVLVARLGTKTQIINELIDDYYNIPSIIVLPCSFEELTMNEVQKIEKIIQKGGLVISQYGYGVERSSQSHIASIHLMSAVSDIGIIFHCNAKSGTYVFLQEMLYQGKDTLIVPKALADDTDKAPLNNQLISEGAGIIVDKNTIVIAIEDIKGRRG